MECNRVVICGKIVKQDALRYTPAGVAVVEFTVNHASKQIEAGIARQISLDIPAIAMAQTATAITALEPDCAVKLTGFLNRKSRVNPQLIFHTDRIEYI